MMNMLIANVAMIDFYKQSINDNEGKGEGGEEKKQKILKFRLKLMFRKVRRKIWFEEREVFENNQNLRLLLWNFIKILEIYQIFCWILKLFFARFKFNFFTNKFPIKFGGYEKIWKFLHKKKKCWVFSEFFHFSKIA